MTLYVLVDFKNAILTSCLSDNLDNAKKSFQEFYQSLDVHDLNKDMVLKYQNGLKICSIVKIDFEKAKIKKLFKEESKLYE